MKTLALIFLLANVATAGYIPPSLPPGSHYQLLFVTTDQTTSTSADIGVYNSFVTNEAALDTSLPATTWHAIISTQNGRNGPIVVNAIDNAPWLGVPVYDTRGQLLTSSSIYSNNPNVATLTHSIADQFGNPSTALAWTGSFENGMAITGNLPFTPAGGTGFVVQGSAVPAGGGLASNWDWLTYAFPAGGTASLFGLSGVLTVPVPEPSGFVLASLVAFLLIFNRLHNR